MTQICCFDALAKLGSTQVSPAQCFSHISSSRGKKDPLTSSGSLLTRLSTPPLISTPVCVCVWCARCAKGCLTTNAKTVGIIIILILLIIIMVICWLVVKVTFANECLRGWMLSPKYSIRFYLMLGLLHLYAGLQSAALESRARHIKNVWDKCIHNRNLEISKFCWQENE